MTTEHDPPPKGSWAHYMEVRGKRYFEHVEADFAKAFGLVINAVRDFLWPYTTAMGYSFGIVVGTSSYILFLQTIFQMLVCAAGMVVVYAVFALIKHMRKKDEVTHVMMIGSWMGAWLSILPWNYGVFLGANYSSDFMGCFTALGPWDANLLASIFTGLFEGFVQLACPFLAAVIADVPGARLEFRALFSVAVLPALPLMILNWFCNSMAGAMWNVVYYVGSVYMTGSTDPGTIASTLSQLAYGYPGTTSAGGSTYSIGIGSVALLSLFVSGVVCTCNTFCPPLMEFFLPDDEDDEVAAAQVVAK